MEDEVIYKKKPQKKEKEEEEDIEDLVYIKKSKTMYVDQPK
jgi:hypothetical protein